MADDNIFEIHTETPQTARHTAAIRKLVQGMLRDTLQFAEGAAKDRAPRRTGNLGRNIGHGPVHQVGNLYWGATGVGRVGVGKTAPYGKWVEAGTGIFGVFRSPIVPTTGNYLRWKVFGYSVPLRRKVPVVAPRFREYFYARSVKGQKPQRFMRQAYDETRTMYVPARIQLLKQEIAAAMKAP